MQRVMSATEARIHFGELMRRVVEDKETVIVERGGKPWVVVLSVEAYERLRGERSEEDWQATLDRVLRLATRIRARRGGKPLPPPEDVIREMREERGARLTGLR